jgi:hypothetical protein
MCVRFLKRGQQHPFMNTARHLLSFAKAGVRNNNPQALLP